MNQMTKKELCYLKEGVYAKQDIAMSVMELFKIPTTKKEDMPKLDITKTVNGRVHTFTGSSHPTYRDAYILQVFLSEAGLKLYSEGDSVKVNCESPEKYKAMIKESNSSIKKDLGLSSQIVFETTFYQILKKAGMSQGNDSKRALIRSLRNLAEVTHYVNKESDYKNGVNWKGFSEPFLSFEFDTNPGTITIKINSLLSTALTGQFTLINLEHKKEYIKNEKYLAMYDFIAGKVNKGETKGFMLDEVITRLEDNSNVSKYLRKKYRNILKTLSEHNFLGKIQVGNRGGNTCFTVVR